MTRDQITAFRLEEFMNRRYEFRWNTVLGELEFRQRDSIHFHFRPADQRVRSSIGQNALKEGISVWDRDVARYLNSDAIPLYNPIEEYLNSTGHWDGKDRIRALADLVPCNNPYWRELFYRWFLSMTAHWQNIDRQHGNNTSPLLVASPRLLVEKYLLFTSCCHPNCASDIPTVSTSKASRTQSGDLGRFFLINIDEFDQISVNQQGFTIGAALAAETRGEPAQALRHRHPGNKTLRLLYSNQQPERPADRPQRQPPFHLHRSHRPHPYQFTINYRQLYAQAMDAIAKGERYWLDDSDEAILKQTNREFEQPTPLEQLFLCHSHPAENEEEGDWMTPMEILSFLQTKTKDRLSINKVALFGRALHKLGISSRRKTRGTEYHVVKKE